MKVKIVDNEYLKENVPRSYYKGRIGTIFTSWNFTIWVFEGVIVALILIIVNYFIFYRKHFTDDGYNSDFYGFGITIFTSIVIVSIID